MYTVAYSDWSYCGMRFRILADDDQTYIIRQASDTAIGFRYNHRFPQFFEGMYPSPKELIFLIDGDTAATNNMADIPRLVLSWTNGRPPATSKVKVKCKTSCRVYVTVVVGWYDKNNAAGGDATR